MNIPGTADRDGWPERIITVPLVAICICYLILTGPLLWLVVKLRGRSV